MNLCAAGSTITWLLLSSVLCKSIGKEAIASNPISHSLLMDKSGLGYRW